MGILSGCGTLLSFDHPIGHGVGVKLYAVSLITLGLPSQRKVVQVLLGNDGGKQGRGCISRDLQKICICSFIDWSIEYV